MDNSPANDAGLEPPAAPEVRRSIRVGVAGWSYPDWRGVLYPRARGRGTADLELVAQLFDCVEINSTFYRAPDPRFAARWARAIEERRGFMFTAKISRDLTHEADVDAAAIRAGVRRLLEGLAPLLEAHRLDALLAQFPPWFRDTPRLRDRISTLVEAVQPVPVVVEIRHRSFLTCLEPGARERKGHFLRFLEDVGAGFVNVDMPPGRSTLPPTVINTSAVGYIRLHGRNVEAWFDRRATRDQKYDYLYGEDSLAEWTRRALALAGRTTATYVIANNHFRAQAPVNALQLLARLGRPVRPPASLTAAYPRLARPRGNTSDEVATGGHE